MIKIIAIGKIKDSNLLSLIKEYQEKINRYHRIEVIELINEDEDNPRCLELESEKIIKHINSDDYVISLVKEGKMFDSLSFAKQLEQLVGYEPNIVFVIGGSLGLSENILSRANLKLSFSLLTFPHKIFRLMLLEQIYRSFKIINNERYHK